MELENNYIYGFVELYDTLLEQEMTPLLYLKSCTKHAEIHIVQ